MILYHVVSTYQLLHSIVHKEKYYSNKKTVVLISEFLCDKFQNYLDLKKSFFDEVIVMDNKALSDRKQDMISNTTKYFDSLLHGNRIGLSEVEEIIVGCAHYYFGIYLTTKGINFTFLEDGSGLISRPEIVYDIEMNLDPNKNEICNNLGLYNASNKYIKKIICNTKAQKSGFNDERIEHMDLIDCIKIMDMNKVEDLLVFFDVNKKISIPENSTLIMTQHFSNLKILSHGDQIEIYKLLVDYFVDSGSIVFKPHPDDLTYYDSIFPTSVVVQDVFPSELIPFVFENEPKTVMTISSTAINNLKGHYEKLIMFSAYFEKHFKIIHKYYTALRVINNANFKENIFEINSDNQTLVNLAEMFDITIQNASNNPLEKSDYKFAKVILMDDTQVNEKVNELLDEVSDDTLLIFINTNNSYFFYQYPNKYVFDNIVPIIINLIDKDSNIIEETQIMWAYSKRKEVRDMVNSIEIQKELTNSNMLLQVNELSEEEIKIKVLEGILSATEKRLDHYIKLESELREKLKKAGIKS